MPNQDRSVSLIPGQDRGYLLVAGMGFIRTVPMYLTSESDSPFGIDSTHMNKDQNKKPEIRLPEDEADVIEIAGAETDEEKALAVAQAR